MRFLRRSDGFTLVELLVVILVIAVLMAVAAPSFLGQVGKAKASTAKQYLTISYKAAKADAIWNHSGRFPAAAVVAPSIGNSEPYLTAVAGDCPADATADDAKQIVVDVSGTGDGGLTLCNSIDGAVYTLVVPDAGAPVISEGGGGTPPVVYGQGTDCNLLATPPTNDEMADACQITGTSAELEMAFSAATFEDGEPIPFWNEDAQDTVWFVWRAPEDGVFQFDDYYTDFGTIEGKINDDTVMAIYTSSTPEDPMNGELSLIGSNERHVTPPAEIPDNYGDTYYDEAAATLVVAATTGTVYWIQVASHTGAYTGTLHMNLSQLPW